MENAAPFSSYWGKLKPRVTIPDSDNVIITVGSHSFCANKKEPLLKLLQPKSVKKTKVFVVVKPSGYLVFPGNDEMYQLVSVVDVKITDSYKFITKLQEFWRLYTQDGS